MKVKETEPLGHFGLLPTRNISRASFLVLVGLGLSGSDGQDFVCRAMEDWGAWRNEGFTRVREGEGNFRNEKVERSLL